MKVVWNKLIPIKGFSAINLFGVLFARRDNMNYYSQNRDRWNTLVNHEAIHTAQMKELLYVGFYLLYFLEFLFRLLFYPRSAYRGISFEKEAYKYENDLTYLDRRKHYSQWRHA